MNNKGKEIMTIRKEGTAKGRKRNGEETQKGNENKMEGKAKDRK